MARQSGLQPRLCSSIGLAYGRSIEACFVPPAFVGLGARGHAFACSSLGLDDVQVWQEFLLAGNPLEAGRAWPKFDTAEREHGSGIALHIRLSDGML